MQNFQVHLGGIIELLSHHLYSSPAVYLRELLQNGVDAIRARQHLTPSHTGHLTLTLTTPPAAPPELHFSDDGVGLTEEETHRFLAVIGESSKRRDALSRDQYSDFIGQFGIGLLSGFIVSDTITVLTRSARTSDHTVRWVGHADGAYEVEVLPGDLAPIGTTVILRARAGMGDWFTPEVITETVQRFGALLPYPIDLIAAATTTRLNAVSPPWRPHDPTSTAPPASLLAYGEALFGQPFFDAVPIALPDEGIEGALYILPHAPSPTAPTRHRVFLKHMLISEHSDNILPPWAFFVACVLDSSALRPVASREAFYDDEILESTRTALGRAIVDYLADLRQRDPARLQALISLHAYAIKALATTDDDFFRLMIGDLAFETTQGPKLLHDLRAQAPLRFVSSVDAFRQLAPVALSQGLLVVNAGYAYAELLVLRLRDLLDIPIEEIDPVTFTTQFDPLDLKEEASTKLFHSFATSVLSRFDVEVTLVRFRPVELPALYVINQDGQFHRELLATQEVASADWGNLLDALDVTQSSRCARLCLNFNNPIIRRLAALEHSDFLETALHMLYVQALLVGHHPLAAGEMDLLNTGFLDLIQFALAPHGAEGRLLQ